MPSRVLQKNGRWRDWIAPVTVSAGTLLVIGTISHFSEIGGLVAAFVILVVGLACR